MSDREICEALIRFSEAVAACAEAFAELATVSRFRKPLS